MARIFHEICRRLATLPEYTSPKYNLRLRKNTTTASSISMFAVNVVSDPKKYEKETVPGKPSFYVTSYPLQRSIFSNLFCLSSSQFLKFFFTPKTQSSQARRSHCSVNAKMNCNTLVSNTPLFKLATRYRFCALYKIKHTPLQNLKGHVLGVHTFKMIGICWKLNEAFSEVRAYSDADDVNDKNCIMNDHGP